MKNIAVVVLYNPKIEEINNIFLYKEVFSKILVYDNSSISSDKYFVDDKIIEYIFWNDNKGLAVPYNLAIEYAKNIISVQLLHC